ncbi:MAG: hypothetical protein KA184_00145 [Candidatus Hydrogenedentes bacterium]|nr:hypothetical protein [Candidatus Hydrogenedentota bacterium]
MELSWQTVKALLREVLEEELGMGRCEIAPKWSGGTLVLKPADPGLKTKEVPIEAFFKKITSVREKLRVMEQKINNHASLGHEDKLELQKLISRAYGSLTTFNVLFRDEEDRFQGVGE